MKSRSLALCAALLLPCLASAEQYEIKADIDLSALYYTQLIADQMHSGNDWLIQIVDDSAGVTGFGRNKSGRVVAEMAVKSHINLLDSQSFHLERTVEIPSEYANLRIRVTEVDLFNNDISDVASVSLASDQSLAAYTMSLREGHINSRSIHVNSDQTVSVSEREGGTEQTTRSVEKREVSELYSATKRSPVSLVVRRLRAPAPSTNKQTITLRADLDLAKLSRANLIPVERDHHGNDWYIQAIDLDSGSVIAQMYKKVQLPTNADTIPVHFEMTVPLKTNALNIGIRVTERDIVSDDVSDTLSLTLVPNDVHVKYANSQEETALLSRKVTTQYDRVVRVTQTIAQSTTTGEDGSTKSLSSHRLAHDEAVQSSRKVDEVYGTLTNVLFSMEISRNNSRP